jgi:hypothetical protein
MVQTFSTTTVISRIQLASIIDPMAWIRSLKRREIKYAAI